MNDIEKLYNSRQTVLQMLKKREYTIDDNIMNLDMNSFKQLYYEQNLDIFIDNGHRSIYIKYLLSSKVKPNTIKEIIETYKLNHLKNEGLDKLMLITRMEPNNTILKIIQSKECKFVQLFWLNKTIIDIAKHSLVPLHIKLNEKEIEELLKKYKISKIQLPIMSKLDPMALYMDLKAGDVCKIFRKSPTCGEYISYRCVK